MECGSLPAFFNVARSVSTGLNKNQLDGADRGEFAGPRMSQGI